MGLMTVYWEYVVIDNMAINSLLLLAASLTLRLRRGGLRIFLSSALGTAITFALTLVSVDFRLALLVKVLTGVLMAAIAAKTSTARQFLFFLLLFFGYTFLLGGLITAFFNLFAVEFTNLVTLNYLLNVPIGLIFAAVAVFSYMIFVLVASLGSFKKINKFVLDVEFFHDGKWTLLKGFIDSGNTLVDDVTNLPVCFVQDGKLLKKLKEQAAMQIMGREIRFESLHYLQFETCAGKGRAPVYKGKIRVGGKIFETAVALGKPSKTANCQLLLNLNYA